MSDCVPTAAPRLSLTTLSRAPAEVARPDYDPAGLSVGIVHLGIGAFHRAHQAVYTDDVLSDGRHQWGICGVAQTRRLAVEQLAAQDGLFTVLTRGTDAASPRVVGAVREVLHAPADAAAVRTRLAHPDVRVVTVTVTEKGYRADLTHRQLDLSDPAIQHDLADPQPARTVVGQLASGFAERLRDDGAPVTVLSCDNLPGNGQLLAALIDEFCARASFPAAAAVRDWLRRHVTFPDTVVDRVVPATTPDDLAEVQRRLGLVDHGAVTAEPFSQWVIEDRFAAARPQWEQAGAILAADVAPFQQAKLRLLNGAHSLLAYLVGAERDATVAEAVADEAVAGVVGCYLAEAAATLADRPAALGGYEQSLLQRFANPAIKHRLRQIAADGSTKLPQRILPVARDRLAVGQEPVWSALAVAAWIRFLRTADRRTDAVADPHAAFLTALAGAGTPAEAVRGVLADSGVVEAELAHNEAFRSAVAGWLDELERHGLHAATRAARNAA